MSSTQTSPAAKPVSMSGTVAESAAMALRSLAGTGKNSIKLRILNEDGVLTRLVMCLSENNNPKLQNIAIETLRNLAAAKEDSIKLKIVNEDGALHGIVTCLFSEHDKGGLQQNAVRTLYNLALAQVDSIKLRIVNEDMALKGLVRTLFQDDKSGLQAYAACPSEDLATRYVGQQKIGNAERTIPGLVKASLERKHFLQMSALGALSALSFSRDCSIKKKIANEDGALVGLVKALREHVQPELSLAATIALKHLANDSSIKKKIANADGALAGLVECLATLGTRAAEVLADVAGTEDVSIKQRMANESGLLVSLVKCLFQTHSASLRQAASRALGNLANTDDDSIKKMIKKGVLAGLVEALREHDKPSLSLEAAMALKLLANDSSIKKKIANADGALAGLVECLAKLGNREAAAEVLANVADTEDVSIKQKMAHQNGLLVGLVKCLSQTHPASLRQAASRALANLANTDDDSIKETMANREGVLASLMKCLPDKPGLQGESFEFPVNRMEGSPDTRLFKRQKVASEDGTSARTSTRLAESLSQHKTPGMQEHVAGAREEVSARACLIKKETCC